MSRLLSAVDCVDIVRVYVLVALEYIEAKHQLAPIVDIVHLYE